MVIDLKKKDNENELEFIWRLHNYISSGDITWKELANAVNEQFRENEESYRDESSYRKPCQSAQAYYEQVFSKMIGNDYADQLADQKRELEQKKIQFRDERNAWNKQNYQYARTVEVLDRLENILKQQGSIDFPDIEPPVCSGDKEMIVMLSDLHIGKCFDNYFGEFNKDIAIRRLADYLQEIKNIQTRHNVKACHVVLLGDLIEGIIHLDGIVTNQENVIEQIKTASELISRFCHELCKVFVNVDMISCSGNHSRMNPNKKEALHDERLDDLIAWNVECSLNHIENFKVLKTNYDTSIAAINVLGKIFVACHGDYDSFSKQGISNLCMMLGYFPYGVLFGHKHYPAHFVEGGIHVIQSGCLSGSGDNYTISNRLSNNASQTALVCNVKGIEAIYNIELN